MLIFNIINLKPREMTREQIIKAADSNSANAFMALLDSQRVNYSVLEMDDICDANEGYCNIAVNGLDAGEAILFIDGEFAGL